MKTSECYAGKSGNLFNYLIIILISLLYTGCNTKNNQTEKELNLDKGTFGYDLDFLGKHYNDLVILENADAGIIISPSLQGRVMTSTAGGLTGKSFGWLNYELIASGKRKEHINMVGGEERFWLGPEGGQFSIYFKSGTTFEFDNWFVPGEIDTEPFDLISSNNAEAHFEKHMQLINYSETIFDLKVDRVIKLLDQDNAAGKLDIKFPKGVQMVGFETENTLTNTGDSQWNKESGMLSIWILSIFNPSDKTTVIVPFKTGDETQLGKVVTDDYFGKMPKERLTVLDSVILFRADGKKRGKIGISPQRALPLAGSYDAQNKVLTVARFSLQEGNMDYVNSQWKMQDQPFAGDAINSYNDGPLADGTQLGPFYELESSSPAAALQPGEKINHVHQTFHFIGEEAALDQIVQSLFGITLSQVKSSQQNL